MEPNNDIEKDDLKESAPKLFSINKENPFDVPENYFDKLSCDISDKCSEPVTIAKKPSHTFQRVLIPMAVAASVIIIILINHKRNDKNVISVYDQISFIDKSAASDYLENLIDNDELDESFIISALINDDTVTSNVKENNVEEKIKALNENPVIINDSINKITITEDDIIQYLLEEDETDDLLN